MLSTLNVMANEKYCSKEGVGKSYDLHLFTYTFTDESQKKLMLRSLNELKNKSNIYIEDLYNDYYDEKNTKIIKDNTVMYVAILEYLKNSKCKIILFEIPCDIMTFIKLNASHNDIENIINKKII